MSKWVNNRLDLGALGSLTTESMAVVWWEWRLPSGAVMQYNGKFQTHSAARRAAVSWLRRALKQASKRLGDTNA